MLDQVCTHTLSRVLSYSGLAYFPTAEPPFYTPLFSFTNVKAAVEPKTDPIAKIPGFPTINESKYRTYNMDVVGGPFDYTKTSPWRAPGTAPVRGKVLMLNNNNDLYRKIKRQKQKHTPHIGSCA